MICERRFTVNCKRINYVWDMFVFQSENLYFLSGGILYRSLCSKKSRVPKNFVRISQYFSQNLAFWRKWINAKQCEISQKYFLRKLFHEILRKLIHEILRKNNVTKKRISWKPELQHLIAQKKLWFCIFSLNRLKRIFTFFASKRNA